MSNSENIQLENGFYLTPISTDDDIEKLRTINEEIWHGFFPAILPAGQTEYMLEKLYNADAIRDKIEHGEKWYLLKYGDHICGHFSYTIHPAESILKFEKSFFSVNYRGHGLFKMLLEYVEKLAKEEDFEKITICTNIRNQRVIELVGKAGFVNVTQENIDIGEGYFMSDYFFEKQLTGTISQQPFPAPHKTP